MRYIFFVVLIICLCFADAPKLLAQQTLADSLRQVLKQELSDTLRTKTLLLLASNLYKKEPDSALSYANEALTIALKGKYPMWESMALLAISKAYWVKSDYETALTKASAALSIAQKENNHLQMANAYMALANILFFLNRKDLDNVEKYNLLAIKHFEKVNAKHPSIKIVKQNLTGVYFTQGKVDKVLANSLELLQEAKKVNHIQDMAVNYYNLGLAYKSFKKYDLAIENFRNADQCDQKLGNKEGAAPLGAMECLLETNKLEEALKASNEYYQRVLSVGALLRVENILSIRIKIHERKKDYASALKDAQDLMMLKDSIYNEKALETQQQIQSSFELKQKEYEKKLLQQDNDLAKAENERQKFWIVSAVVGLCLLSLLGLLLLRNNRRKQETNRALSLKNNQIEAQKQQLTRTNAEISQLMEEVVAQRDSLEQQGKELYQKNTAMTQSIQYAERIQKAMLPDTEKIRANFGEHFIIYRPKHIVSGDFYWTMRVGETCYMAAADCTGHGVPGAFMSMIGESLLNKIVLDNQIYAVNNILEALHTEVRQALNQTQTRNQDGMDISLIAWHKQRQELEFTGAKNPAILIQNNDLQILKADKQSIGGYKNSPQLTFVKQTLVLDASNDCFCYLFSDGFQDQFGGEHKRKIMSTGLRSLLLQASQMPIAQQSHFLNQFFEDWLLKGHENQLDDVLIIGLKLT